MVRIFLLCKCSDGIIVDRRSLTWFHFPSKEYQLVEESDTVQWDEIVSVLEKKRSDIDGQKSKLAQKADMHL